MQNSSFVEHIEYTSVGFRIVMSCPFHCPFYLHGRGHTRRESADRNQLTGISWLESADFGISWQESADQNQQAGISWLKSSDSGIS